MNTILNKHKNMIYFVTILLANFFLFSCTKPKPVEIVPIAKKPTSLALVDCTASKAEGAEENPKTLDLIIEEDLKTNPLKLALVPEPSDASLDNLVWETDDADSKNINLDATSGEFTLADSPTPEDKVIISVKTQDGAISDSCQITLRRKVAQVTNIVLIDKDNKPISQNTPIQMKYSSQQQIRFIATGEDNNVEIETSNFKWARTDTNSTDFAQISVDERTGLITVADKSNFTTTNPTATIEVTSPNNVKASFSIKVIDNIMADQVLLDNSLVEFVPSNSSQEQFIYATVRPYDTFNKELTLTNGQRQGNGISIAKVAGSENKYKITSNSSSVVGDYLQVTFTTKDSSNKSATLMVKIIQEPVAVTSLKIKDKPAGSGSIELILNAENYGYYEIDKLQKNLEFEILPTTATNKNVLWNSSNEAVAIVADGSIKAKGIGTATITATSQSDPSKTDSVTVTVTSGVNVTSLDDINYDKGFVLYGEASSSEAFDLTTKIQPTDATNKTITWISTNPDVMEITAQNNESVTIQPKGFGGETIIVAITQDGNKVKKIKINTGNIGMQKIKVPTGGWNNICTSDTNCTGSINQSFYIAKTELVFSLWEEVYKFATTKGTDTNADKRIDGGVIYTFSSTGNMGNRDPKAPKTIPVAALTYKDALAFCNAMTEYYNYKKNLQGNNKLEAVYLNSSKQVYRNSNESIPSTSDVDNTKTGFRLATNTEWELAARVTDETNDAYILKNNSNVARTITIDSKIYRFLKDNRASGEKTGVSVDDVAWYKTTSAPINNPTQYLVYPVALKKANTLGLYDMSGNLAEWILSDAYSGKRIVKGGRYDSEAAGIKLGLTPREEENNSRRNLGMRLVRSIDN